MGLAVLAEGGLALAFTVVLARLLGATGYGSLIALVAAFLILSIPGSALQVTVAREVSAGESDAAWAIADSLRRWIRRLAAGTLALALAAVLLREPLAALIGVDAQWAAAATLPMAGVWSILSIERGVLQGMGAYRAVALSMIGEVTGWLAFGSLLVLAGLGTTGAFLGVACALLVTSLALAPSLYRRLVPSRPDSTQTESPLRALVRRSLVPIAALTLFAALLNLDVIVVGHLSASGAAAGAYASASVASKVVVWLAVGLGLYLLPEAARRANDGAGGRAVLARALALAGGVAGLLVLLYAVAGRPLLTLVFGSELAAASAALPVLAAATALLACSYLCVQYLLALGRSGFLWLLAVATVAEPTVLVIVGPDPTNVALGLLAVQAALGALLLTLASRPVQSVAPADSPGWSTRRR